MVRHIGQIRPHKTIALQRLNIKFLVDNIYIQIGNKIFTQICIPMGTDCSPLVANLFLFS